MRFALVALLVLAAAPCRAQTAEPATLVQVTLSNFKFTPSTITLQHGQPYVLHIVNTSGGGHSFEAEAFFDAATVDAADSAPDQEGRHRA